MAKGKGELAVEISPARLLGVLAHILTHQLHCAVGGHSCISHVAEAQDCSATPPPSTSTSSPDTSSRCLCQTVWHALPYMGACSPRETASLYVTEGGRLASCPPNPLLVSSPLLSVIICTEVTLAVQQQ